MYKPFISDLLETVDFVLSDETVVFRTCAKEKNKVVFQLVSSFISFFIISVLLKLILLLLLKIKISSRIDLICYT